MVILVSLEHFAYLYPEDFPLTLHPSSGAGEKVQLEVIRSTCCSRSVHFQHPHQLTTACSSSSGALMLPGFCSCLHAPDRAHMYVPFMAVFELSFIKGEGSWILLWTSNFSGTISWKAIYSLIVNALEDLSQWVGQCICVDLFLGSLICFTLLQIP